jgi:hypothetical protein
VFEGESQDFEFLASRFREHWKLVRDPPVVDGGEEIETTRPYSVKDVIADGVFLKEAEIEAILKRLRARKT